MVVTLKIAIMVGFLFSVGALLTWVDRRQSAMIQDRIGPNRAVIKIPFLNIELRAFGPPKPEVAGGYEGSIDWRDRLVAFAPELLLQGPVADALTHVGQMAMLRRLAGSPVRGENYLRADIVAGRVGPEQSRPLREFD